MALTGFLQVPIHFYRQMFYGSGIIGTVAKTLNSETWYTTREATDLLGNAVTEPTVKPTVKEYCKSGRLKAKKVGPKKRWMVLGSSIGQLLKQWQMVV
jgi:hypothetical protein